MGRMECGLPCPYHSPARSETLGQASTSHARSCKTVARSLPVATCLCRGHVDARQLPALFIAGPRWSHTARTLPTRTFYEQGSLRALRGLRALLTLFWPTSCQTRPRRRPKQCAISPSVAHYAPNSVVPGRRS